MASRPQAPRVLLIGEAGGVEQALGRLKAQVECSPWTPLLVERLDRRTAGVVIVPPLAGLRPWRAVQVLREAPWGGSGGIFVVLRDEATGRQVRRLYDAGATAVFEWARDAPQLAELVAQTLGIEQAWGKASHADVAIARVVRARLKLAASLPDGLQARCRDGVVLLSGAIDGLWQQAFIGDLVARVPGVRGVETGGLRVPASGRTDSELLREVKRMLRGIPATAEETLSVAVERGYVTVAGSVKSHRELEGIIRSISDIRGVREIDNLVVVSPAQRDSDRATARRLQDVMSRLFPATEVSVEAFGGVIVLRGRVGDLSSKRRIERIVREDASTKRVIDKLVV